MEAPGHVPSVPSPKPGTGQVACFSDNVGYIDGSLVDTPQYRDRCYCGSMNNKSFVTGM